AGGAGDVTLQAQDLDTLVTLELGPEEPIALIKSDVDGSDADVLQSGLKTIAKHQPLLFFEAECRTIEAVKAYANVFKSLAELGYDSFTAFDNFGLPLVQQVNAITIVQIMNYCANMNQGRSTRTFYYVDVLASSTVTRKCHESSLSSFRRNYNLF